jgi:hypothetical protein
MQPTTELQNLNERNSTMSAAQKTNREIAEKIVTMMAMAAFPAMIVVHCFISFLKGGMEQASNTLFIYAFMLWYIWIPALLLGIVWAMIAVIAGGVWVLEVAVGFTRRHLFLQVTQR